MRTPSTSRTAKSARAKRSLTLLGVLAVLAAVAGYALAAPKVAAPRITSGPAETTRSTTATFAFRGERGLTLECSLDDAPYRACTSPISYRGLAPGFHEFDVRARDARGRLSDDAEREWWIDTSAPYVSLSHPDDGATYGPERWDDGCSGSARVCGRAEDRSGVDDVLVSIRRAATGLYWNGRAFASVSQLFLPASGEEHWRLTLPLPSADGAYEIRVRAVDELGNATAPGAERSATFHVDRTPPPAPTIVDGPPNPSNDDDAEFAFSSSEPGARFLCRLDGERDWDRCDADEEFRNLRDGWRTLHVRAVDRAGNVGPAATWSWRIDTDDPPKPKIVQHPANPSSTTSATFGFTDKESGVAFECRLDRGPWSACTSPIRYDGLGAGNHTFSVRAVDAAGNRSDAANFSWSVVPPAGGEDFTVSGDLASVMLAPGVSAPLPLTISNPNDEPIFVTAITVTVQAGSTNPGCDGPANLAVTPSDASEANPLVVPANGSVTLPAGGVSAPLLEMLNLPTNQDACKGATFTFSYGGSAHS
jgi:large repetitive protein